MKKLTSPQSASSSITESVLPPSESTTDELSRLRDILFGSQTRAVETRLSDLDTRLQTIQNDLTDRLDKQAAELRTAQKELNKLIKQVQVEARDLRQELLDAVASLESRKASRQELGQMLAELGLRLQHESESPSSRK